MREQEENGSLRWTVVPGQRGLSRFCRRQGLESVSVRNKWEAEKDDSWSSSQPAHEMAGITSHSLAAKGRGEVASIEPLL